MEAQIAAVAAFLDIEFVALRRLPPRTILLVDMGQRLA